ncbi:CBS domain-containing protein [Intestinibaculum porci]|uniref:hypothetical protein n=1 Tax=Intestinibaculum porci TaxID=2487118 RepID=UPI001300B4D0|nr:hypothetical protein [Intestinibaculum porci]
MPKLGFAMNVDPSTRPISALACYDVVASTGKVVTPSLKVKKALISGNVSVAPLLTCPA